MPLLSRTKINYKRGIALAFTDGLSYNHTNNNFPFYSHFPSVREFKVLYGHGLN